MTVCVYTAIMGTYDWLRPHPPMAGVDFVAFTDASHESAFWDVRRLPPTDEHPRTAAKFYKLFPHLILPEYEYTVWIDANHEILVPSFADQCIAAIGASGVALYVHSTRDCIYEEAEASVGMRKYSGLPIREQVEHYREQGHPEHWGLYGCPTIARRNTAAVAGLMTAWGGEIARWTYQDQLSFPVVCRRAGIRPDLFPLKLNDGNAWQTIGGHASDL